jgi:hypothetical protein
MRTGLESARATPREEWAVTLALLAGVALGLLLLASL